MATFSENQVRHLFVANSLGTTGVGAISVDNNSTELFLKYIGADGPVKTDSIPFANVTQAQAFKYTKMSRPLNKYTVALDANVNGGAPLAGQDYLTRVKFYEWGSISFDDQYFKHGVVHATTGMTAEQFYQAMAASLVLNMSREKIPLLNVTLNGTAASIVLTSNAGVTVTADNVGTAGNAITFAITDVAAATAAVTVTGSAISVALTAAAKTIADLKAIINASATAAPLVNITGTDTTVLVTEAARTLTGGTTTGIILEEVEQPWTLGTKESQPLNYLVQCDKITLADGDYVWGTSVKSASSNAVLNGKITADMEYFFVGERGDQYRNVGFPNVIKTAYLVDPTVAYNYIEIDYFYQGEGTNVQKSQKHLTIVVPAIGANNAAQIALANSIIAAITVGGITIAALV